MGLGNLAASFEASPEELTGCWEERGSVLVQGPEPAEWGERSEGKGDNPHWACCAEPLAAVQAEVLDTVH